MDNLEKLFIQITTAVEDLSRLMTNLKKLGRNNFTVELLQSRLTRLNTLWSQCEAVNVQIRCAATKEQQESSSYFSNDYFGTATDKYWEISDYITTAIASRTPPPPAHQSQVGDFSLRESARGSSPQLPRIPLPKFSGSYIDWISFRDLFKSLVSENESLTNVEKLHYLKVSAEGEAQSLLKNITITDSNFQVAWDLLLNRYDQTRHIIDAQLKKLFDVPAVKTENVRELKQLRDQTNEAVNALKNLDRAVDTWDDILTFITVRKLDAVSRRDWEMKVSEQVNYPTYKQIHTFLEHKIRAIESITPQTSSNKSSKQNQNNPGTADSVKSHVSTASKCCDCNSEHPLHKCEQFRSKSIEQRQKLVREKHLCGNCMAGGHHTKQCPSRNSCFHCKQRHHTLLHLADQQVKRKSDQSHATLPYGNVSNKAKTPPLSTPTTALPNHQGASTSVESLHASKTQMSSKSVMLATAWVRLISPTGYSVKIRALLDQGSQTSFITESVAQILKAPRKRVQTTITGIGGLAAGTSRSCITFALTPCTKSMPSIQCEALVFQKLTSYVPNGTIDHKRWAHLDGLELADPDPTSAVPIQLILGADIYSKVLRSGLKRGPAGSPLAQHTIFGWVLSGPIEVKSKKPMTEFSSHLAISDSKLSSELRRFWELEEVPACAPLTEDEAYCEAHFAANHKRLPEGRYCVKLPFKKISHVEIGASSQTAVNWLQELERKFTREPELLTPYRAFMQEYLDLGHMVPTTFNSPESNPGVFLPHHPVIKESSTTRLRVVFNASSRTSNGTSLNDHLLIGPKLQADLSATILKWRTHQFALTADITKMYRQILVDHDDTRYQQILWRSSPSDPITPYRLTTVTYGTASAPYLALRVLKQLADDEEKTFPLAARIVRDQFYIDDALFGANDENTANQLRLELVKLLSRGGFTLRKWMASHPSLLEPIPQSDRESTKVRTFDSSEAIKILGINWVPGNDSFCFNTNLPNRDQYTKRAVLSITAQLFDPLGWLSPVLIAAKIFLQELWIASFGWDDKLSPEFASKWNDYCSNLPKLHAVSVPRWTYLESNESRCQLHGFADASTRAYAAVIYLRVLDKTDQVRVSLLIAKSKVAPIKTVSVPRLELCAAALLAKLMKFTWDTMQLTSCTTYAWSDSTVVIAWLKQHPSSWPTFVANRVSLIQTLLPEVAWRHVSTAQNPADCASRGLTASELHDHRLWWQGPSWLHEDESTWPRSLPSMTDRDITTTKVTLTASEPTATWTLADDISSWPKLLRVTAYCMRIAARAQHRLHSKDLRLGGNEVTNAKIHWIKTLQLVHFQEELLALTSQKSISNKSVILKLNPFVDEAGILRVGGRLQRSPLSFNEKHPIILPKHRITSLIVEHAHLRSLHGGPQLTTSVLRQDYWILGHRSFVRSIIHKCVICVRQRAALPQQIMGNLPAARTTPSRPFQHSGLDYAGPFQVRTSKGRGHKSHKAYLALFVCLSTRAIHLELVSDYTTEAFLAAFRRFASRRGLPSDLYSDNGTNFTGADKELQTMYSKVIRDTELTNILATDQINWHFIPPGAPHFGGLWEAGVKCTKHHLRRVLGTKTLTFEEFTTLITQIEACLNSRPIGPTGTDPNDFSYLTPGHLLIGAPLTSVPEPSVLDLNENRLSRWQLVRHTLELFWKRWSSEYLQSLQVRTKWRQVKPDVQLGDLVIVRNENLPPSKWLLGRIILCHPGPDARTRVVTIQTAHSQLKRPITQICILPVNTTDSISPPDSTSS